MAGDVLPVAMFFCAGRPNQGWAILLLGILFLNLFTFRNRMGCQTQLWCRPMRAHVKLVILSVPFPEVRNRKGTESGRCQRTFKEYRHSKILVPIPTCGIFPWWIAVHRIDNAGDLFLFRDKKWNVQIFLEMYIRPKKCTKFGCALIVILRQRCAYFAIFETQLRINGEFDHQKDSAIFGIHNTSQTKVRIFSLPRSPIFNLRWFECLKFQ